MNFNLLKKSTKVNFSSDTRLVVGLGNVGLEYEYTRHNIGFRIVESLANGESWQELGRCKSYVCKLTLGNQEVVLAKPTTMMNLSGQAVSRLAQFYKIAPENIWIVQDELDLPLGRLKIVTESGHNGHNGIRSIQEQLGHNRFWRFRIGINTREHREVPGPAYVLQNFTQAEQQLVTETIKLADRAIKEALIAGLPHAIKRYNKATVKIDSQG